MSYRFIIKKINKIDKVYIRTLIIVLCFFIGICSIPVDEETIKIAQEERIKKEELKKQEENRILEQRKLEAKQQELKKQEEAKKLSEQKANKEQEKNRDAIKEVNQNTINATEINNSIDTTMISQFTNLGFNIEEATKMQKTFYQMGIKSLSNIHSGTNNPDINKLVAFVAIANNNNKQKFYFTIENKKMFYAGFQNEDLFDSEKGGILKNINDVHIPETYVSIDEYSKLQVLAQDEIKKYLNYPDTASFPLYDGWGIARNDNNYKIIGNVEAKNGFNVKSKNNFSVYFIKENDIFNVDAVLINGNRLK